MNVDHIYQLQRDEAFAAQFSAAQYQTFVAMPFTNRGGYPEERIKKMLLEEVHESANAKLAPDRKRTFAPPRRVDRGPGGAIVITDQIIADILSCHFFVGDLTGGNFGVVLETGVALAVKPNARVLLLTQDDTASIHFDLKVTNLNRYREADLVTNAAMALVAAADVFENEADNYIRFLSSQLTPDAIMLLNIYGQMNANLHNSIHLPIFAEKAAGRLKHFSGEAGRMAFYDCVRELNQRRLLWTDYKANAAPGTDSYGIFATKLGWRVIEQIWQHDPTMRERDGAPTGPNID